MQGETTFPPMDASYLFFIRRIRARIQQLLEVKLHFFAGIRGDIEDLRVHTDRVLRAYFDAKTAVNAHAEVQVERGGHFLDVRVRMLFGHDVDAARRAYGLAHHARDTAR